MESKLLLLVIIEDTSMNLQPLVAALSNRFRTTVVRPENVPAFGGPVPDAVLIAGVPPDKALALCSNLRASLPDPSTAIVAYTSVSGKATRLSLIGAGVDDVIEAPTDGEELCVRLCARVDRLRAIACGHNQVHSIRAGRLCLDLDRMEARVGPDKVPLGPVEFKILCVLAKGLDKLRSRDEIETFVWGDNKPASRALDPHINALRKKIVGSELELRTVYGAGYSLRSLSGRAESRETRS